MSLDITILDREDKPLRSVELGVDEHYSVMANVEKDRFPLLYRMKDYYEDAIFTPSEFPALREELKLLKHQYDGDPALLGILDKLTALVDEAGGYDYVIQALAD